MRRLVRLDRDSYVGMTLSFLLGRTVLAGSLAPFAPAFYAGLRAFGGALPTLCALTSMLGSASLGRWDLLGYHALAMVLATALVKPVVNHRTPVVLDALLAGAIVAAARGVAAAVQSPTLFSYISALLEGLCAVVIAVLASLAFSPDRDKTPAAQEKGSEALLVMALLSLGGLHGLSVLGVRLEVAAVMACTLAVGYAAGPGAGAIAGLAGGLIVSLTGNEDPAILGILGASGLLAGIGGWFGKLEAILAYMSAGLLMSLYAVSPDALKMRLIEQAVSCAAIVLVTPRTARMFAERFPVLAASRSAPRPRPRPEASAMRTAAVAHALLEMGEMFSQVSSFSSAVHSRPAGALTPGDPQAPVEPEVPRTDPSGIKQVAERVCRECTERIGCWEERFGETYEALSDLIRKMQVTGQVAQGTGQSDLADRCQKFPEILAALNHHQEIQRLERRIRALDDETKECLAFQYRCLGQLLASRGDAGADGDARPRRQRLKVTFRGDSTPAEGSSRPGDMWVKYDLSPGRTLAILVDGMGKGEAAASQSRETIEILKSLLDCGLDYDSCVSFLNSALFLSCRPDSFVAVDCLLIDQDTERAYFHKLGAPPSFIKKKDGNVLVVRGSRPPAGAFNALPCFATNEPISAGDEIYMVSDGIFRCSPVPARAEHLLVSRLRRMKESSLDSSVRTLLGCGQKFHSGPPDDVTVVVARIERV